MLNSDLLPKYTLPGTSLLFKPFKSFHCSYCTYKHTHSNIHMEFGMHICTYASISTHTLCLHSSFFMCIIHSKMQQCTDDEGMQLCHTALHHPKWVLHNDSVHFIFLHAWFLMLIPTKYPPLNVFLKPFMSWDALKAPHLKDQPLNCNNLHAQNPSEIPWKRKIYKLQKK